MGGGQNVFIACIMSIFALKKGGGGCLNVQIIGEQAPVL